MSGLRLKNISPLTLEGGSLTVLDGDAYAGEALMDGVKQSREDYEATGRIIVRETLRLRRLVNDLHMMAKVEAGFGVVLAIEAVVMAVEEVLATKEVEVLVAEAGMAVHQMDFKVVLPQMHRLVPEEIEDLVGMEEVALAALRMVEMALDRALGLVQMAVGMAVTHEEAASMMTDPLTAATEAMMTVVVTEAVAAIASR